MDVTSENFDMASRVFLNALDRTSVIAFDCEFTGLQEFRSRNPQQKQTLLGDENNKLVCVDMEEEYSRLYRPRANDNIPLQVGLCLLQFNGDSITALPFNFNVFPLTINEAIASEETVPSDTFASQLSSIRFLRSHGFDFNKCFSFGIPFASPKSLNLLRNELKKEDYLQDDLLDEVRGYSKDAEMTNSLHVWLPVDRTSLFVKIYLEQKFPNLHVEPNGQSVILSKRSDSSFSSGSNDTSSATTERDHCTVNIEKIVNLASGFSALFSQIVQRRIPVVGHNCLTDITIMLRAFHSDMPDSMNDFVKTVHTDMFPLLWDTKYVIKTLKAQMPEVFTKTPTSLSCLYDHLKVISSQNPNFVLCPFEIPSEFNRYLSDQVDNFDPTNNDPSNYKLPRMISSHAAHEAGYDAWMTGVCLLRMVDIMNSVRKQPRQASGNSYGEVNSNNNNDDDTKHLFDFSTYRTTLRPFDNCVNVIGGPISVLNFSVRDVRDHAPTPTFEFQLSNLMNNLSYVRSLVRNIECCEVNALLNTIRVRGEHSKHLVEKALEKDSSKNKRQIGYSIRACKGVVDQSNHSTGPQIGSILKHRRSALMAGSGLLAVCVSIGVGIYYSKRAFSSIER